MNEYLQFKGRIQQRLDVIEDAIRGLEELHWIEDSAASRWRAHLRQVETSLRDPLLRIAVVGSVKSGKSTLVNTLVGRDLLKRGAGVITAFITRIQTGEEPGGWVELKPWAQVLDELNAAVRMLPFAGEEIGNGEALDMRKAEDRERLQGWLARMRTEWQQFQGRLDPHFILLNAYLEGYSRLHKVIGESVNRLMFDEHSMGLHRQYVGEEAQAVYLRDMELHCPVPWLGDEVEIADCQGSDSPNPAHLELLQQYMLGSHFILYTISSRTGLREADFKLLDFIKTLGMFPQTFFVLNLDLDVHPNAEDLTRLIERVRTELGWVVPNPQLFAFSALYHLAEQPGDAVPERDRLRMGFWMGDPAMVELTERGFAAFREHLVHRVSGQRARVLIGSGLNRLSMTAGSITDTARACRDLIGQNLGSLKTTAEKLKTRQKALHATLGTLENAVLGLEDALRREIDEVCDRYFDLSRGPIIRETMDMVEHYPVDSPYLQDLSDPRQAVRRLHQFYLEFRQSLFRYLVEKVNLRVIGFAREQERFLDERLRSSSHAFWSLFVTALEDYRRDLAALGIELRPIDDPQPFSLASLASVDTAVPPAFSTFVGQEALGRGVLLMKFGIGKLAHFLTTLKTRLGKGGSLFADHGDGEESLHEIVQLVKSETRTELLHAFRSYRKTFKTDYLGVLLEKGTRYLSDGFRVRAEMAELDFANLLHQGEVEGERRRAMMEELDRVIGSIGAVLDELEALRCAINLEWLPCEAQANPPVQEPTRSVPLP